jgi:CheY-like chemotaxis protein
VHLKLARLLLGAAGFNVSDAEAAEQAFHAIAQEKPDVILLDLALPGFDSGGCAEGSLDHSPDDLDETVSEAKQSATAMDSNVTVGFAPLH